jgi:hypothetical protein
MPTPLKNLRMHPPWDKMMIRKRDPIALADLTSFCPRARPHGWACRHARRVLCEYGAEEVEEVCGVGNYAVDCERVGDANGDWGAEGFEGFLGEGCIGVRRDVEGFEVFVVLD